jgi:hypothetical protein
MPGLLAGVDPFLVCSEGYTEGFGHFALRPAYFLTDPFELTDDRVRMFGLEFSFSGHFPA